MKKNKKKTTWARDETRVNPVLHENVPLIEVADSVLLDALFADNKTGQWLAARLSDRVAVVAPGAQDKLIERMRRQGHLPKVLCS